MGLFLNFLILIPLKFPDTSSSFKMYVARASLRSPLITIEILKVFKLQRTLIFNPLVKKVFWWLPELKHDTASLVTCVTPFFKPQQAIILVYCTLSFKCSEIEPI